MSEEAKEPKRRDPSALQRAYERGTAADGDALRASSPVPRKSITFVMDLSEQCPGAFDDDEVEVTLQALTSKEEVAAVRGVLDALEVVHKMARASVHLINGAPCVGAQLDWFWEIIGTGGRSLVEVMYQEVGSLGPAALGKARSSARTR